MIKLIVGRAPNYVEVDGKRLDSWESLAQRMTLRGRVDEWRASLDAKNYPEMRTARDENQDSVMIVFMLFETEEEAALFKLTFPDVCRQ